MGSDKSGAPVLRLSAFGGGMGPPERQRHKTSWQAHGFLLFSANGAKHPPPMHGFPLFSAEGARHTSLA
ncbi:MAG TPA: hypothetical protein PLM14_14845 [Candidatus Hydrogenedentes bacterium]|nr:hypothetical protein [Candidatus Hydrogenedentota bacterium]